MKSCDCRDCTEPPLSGRTVCPFWQDLDWTKDSKADHVVETFPCPEVRDIFEKRQKRAKNEDDGENSHLQEAGTSHHFIERSQSYKGELCQALCIPQSNLRGKVLVKR